MSDTTLYLSADDLRGLAEPSDYVDAAREAYRERGEGMPANAPSSLATVEPHADLTGYMAMLPGMGVMGGYMYSVGGPDRDGWFITPLWDIHTGELLALLDGGYWNPLKTGAAGAVGADQLAREDVETVGVIGTSRGAYGALQTLDVVRDLAEVRVYSRTPENRERFAAALEEPFGVDGVPVDSSDAAVEGVDLLITATVASDPVFDGTKLEPGIHVNAMGQSGHERELDVEAFRRADKYVPDLRERVFAHGLQERLRMAGGFVRAYDEGVVGENQVYAELGSIVAGRIPGRTDDDEITIFDSTGVGVETVACGAMLYERAVDAGLGTELSITSYKDATPGPGEL